MCDPGEDVNCPEDCQSPDIDAGLGTPDIDAGPGIDASNADGGNGIDGDPNVIVGNCGCHTEPRAPALPAGAALLLAALLLRRRRADRQR